MARDPEYDRMLDSMRAYFHLIGQSSAGAHVLELDGVMASVCPRVPERSLPNSVLYESQEALLAALPELARRYDEAGIKAWTVWTPEDDSDAAGAMADAGHVLDADPAAMSMELAALGQPPELDYREGEELLPVVASINDRSYPFEGTPFTDITADRPSGTAHDYVAYLDGEPAAALAILDVRGDASVWEVGTLPEARGRGLASRLLHRALWDARERGCDISTLQATKVGEPVYARLGYHRHGAVQMWERRRG